MSVPASVTSADEQAIAAVVDHHAALLSGLRARVLALEGAVSEGASYERPLVALTAYLATSVLPHAAAEEAVLYPALAADAGGGLFVDAMLLDHEELTERTRALANVCDPYVALALVEGAMAVFALHVRKENELLLPALQRAEGVSFAALLRSMQERLGESGTADAARDVPEPARSVALDVRSLPHGRSRHDAIFARLLALDPGERLVIVNDDDPLPLRYQIDAAWPGMFGWEYLQAGPRVWEVAIARRQVTPHSQKTS